VYESEGRYAEAADVLERLTLGQPTDAALHYRLGIILAVTDPAAAREHLALASGLDPSFRAATDALDAAINYALATDDPAAGAGLIGYTLVNLEQYGLAEVALQSAIELDPDYADAYAYLGLSADRRGGDGLQQYEQALALDPDSALAHTLTGIYWKQHGDQARALAELTRANELDPLNAAISAELAGVHAARADLTAAEEWYLNAVRLAPNDTTFWTLLARFYLDYDFKAIEQGLPAARTATEHGPIYAPAHDALGHALVVAGRADEAESALLRALELDPEYAPAYFHLGLAYLELDRQDDAVRSLQTALTLDPDGPTGNRALNTLARLPADGG
ncbi:MAG: tetratricopeptide repeat protein, partial [Anaerolineales bacterium]